MILEQKDLQETWYRHDPVRIVRLESFNFPAAVVGGFGLRWCLMAKEMQTKNLRLKEALCFTESG